MSNFSKSPTYSCSCVYGDSIQNTKAKKRTKERNAVHFLFSFFRSFFPSLFHSRAEVDCTALHTLLTTGMYESNCYYYWHRKKNMAARLGQDGVTSILMLLKSMVRFRLTVRSSGHIVIPWLNNTLL